MTPSLSRNLDPRFTEIVRVLMKSMESSVRCPICGLPKYAIWRGLHPAELRLRKNLYEHLRKRHPEVESVDRTLLLKQALDGAGEAR